MKTTSNLFTRCTQEAVSVAAHLSHREFVFLPFFPGPLDVGGQEADAAANARRSPDGLMILRGLQRRSHTRARASVKGIVQEPGVRATDAPPKLSCSQQVSLEGMGALVVQPARGIACEFASSGDVQRHTATLAAEFGTFCIHTRFKGIPRRRDAFNRGGRRRGPRV